MIKKFVKKTLLFIAISRDLHAETKPAASHDKPKSKKIEHFPGGTVIDGQASDILKSSCAVEEFLPILKLEPKVGAPSDTVLYFKMINNSERIKMTVATEQVSKLKIKKGMRLCSMDDEENRN